MRSPFLRMTRVVPLLGLVGACGGPPAQPPITNIGPLPSATAAPTAGPAVDLSPVSEPRNLLMIVHVAKPAKLVSTVGGWAGLPLPVGELLDETFGDGVGPVLDTSQPIDIAIAVETRGRSARPVFAFAAGVRSVDDVKGALGSSFAFTPLTNGAFRIEATKTPRRGDDDDGPMRTRPCVVAPAFGTSAARVVCGNKLASVDQMWPYLVRGATRVAATSDVHVEMRADALRALFGERTPFAMLMHEMSSEGPLALGLLSDLNDFGTDADKVIVDVNVDDAAGHGTATLSLREAKSPLSRMAVAHADRVGPPPAPFLRLPIDSDAALFSGGIEPKDLDHTKQMIVEGIAQRLETRQGLSAAESKATQTVLTSTIDVLTAPLVFAKGVDSAGVTAALGTAKATKAGPAKTAADAAAYAKLGGWDVVGVELPIAKVGGVAKDWSALFAKPGVAKWLKTEAGDAPPLTMKAAPVPKGLPTDSLHFVLSRGVVGYVPTPPPPPPPPPGARGALPKPPPPQKPPVFVNTLHLYLVPDGGRTWMAWSLDDATALEKAKGLVGAAGQGATLASRPGIEEIKAARANSGGFVTLRSLALDGPLPMLGSLPAGYLERSDPLRGFGGSAQGATPVSFWVAATSQTTMTLTGHVPRALVRDVMSAGGRIRF